MKVLLANVPWYTSDRLGVRAGVRWPFTVPKEFGEERVPGYLPFPFMLSQAAALLKKDGFDVLLVDAIAEGMSYDDFRSKVNDFKPQVLVVETSTPSFKKDIALVESIKSGMPSLKAVFCGSHVTTFPENTLRENNVVDFVILGEYEFILEDLVFALRDKKKNLAEVKGIVYKSGADIINNGQASLANVNLIPWPAREFLPMFRYADIFHKDIPKPSLQMLASRGCPFGCVFCLYPDVMFQGKSYRTRDADDIMKELKFCIDQYGFKSFYFDDDTFNLNKKHVMEICSKIKEYEINIPWLAMCRADTIDEEMVKAMVDSGLVAIKFGVESGVQRVVDASGKSLDLSKVKRSVKWFQDAGIRVHCTFTLGLPTETFEDAKKTIEFALELDPDSAQFSINTPFPGTKYFEILDRQGYILTKDWEKYDGTCSSVIRTENLTAKQLEDLKILAQKRWDRHLAKKKMFKPAYIKEAVMNPAHYMRRIKQMI